MDSAFVEIGVGVDVNAASAVNAARATRDAAVIEMRISTW